MTHFPVPRAPLGALLISALALVAALAGPGPAHNGSVAVAYPIRGISVDGDLSDWPASRERYPVDRALVGPSPSDTTDFRGWFRVAYDQEENSLYLAIEVDDDSVAVDTVASWNGSDGCEVFVDLPHGRESSTCVQNVLYGEHHLLYTSGFDADVFTPDSSHATVAYQRTDGRHQYEWRLDVAAMGDSSTAMRPGLVIGLDLSIGDRDGGGQFSWVAWGRGIGKLGAPQRRGDLVLAASPEAMGAAAGLVRWKDESEGIPPRRVRVVSRQAPEQFWLQLNTAVTGAYDAPLPAGEYRLESVDVRVLGRGSKTRTFKVQAGRETPVKDLVVKPVKDRGVLVDQLLNHLGPGDPGVAILVARGGELLHRKGYGLANMELGVPITPESKFRLASVSKQFTAVAVMQLAERGLVDIEAPLSTYLPDYPSGDRITTRQVMAHTSGVPNILSMSEFWDISTQHRDLPELIDVFREEPLGFEPGERWSYSNGGYVLLAALVEKVSGQPFAEYLEEHIFEPLGMENTGSADQEAILPGKVSGYMTRDDSFINPYYMDLDLAIGLAGVYSTVDDLYLWDQALYTERIIAAATRQVMFTRQVLNDSTETAYGLGWRVGDVNGLTEIAHSGLLNGFTSRFARFPDQRFFVVVLCNNPRLSTGELAAQIAEIYLSNSMEWEVAAAPDRAR